jgi:signal transduction histidine kinase
LCPAKECREVFKRFYRLERSRNRPGNGLGLSLVAAVAHLHGIRVNIADNLPGTRVELEFPAARQQIGPPLPAHTAVAFD